MANYEKMEKMAADLFLENDQEQLLARYPLEHDDSWIRIDYLGVPHCIERATGFVYESDGATLAAPSSALAILDMVCNKVGTPHLVGKWQTMDQVSGASKSPGTSGLFDEKIASFTGKLEELQAACDDMGFRRVPGGEVSGRLDVFPGFPVWLQYWDADDEFPAQMSFLWDASTPLYLHFETLWYILYDILDGLLARCGIPAR